MALDLGSIGVTDIQDTYTKKPRTPAASAASPSLNATMATGPVATAVSPSPLAQPHQGFLDQLGAGGGGGVNPAALAELLRKLQGGGM